MGQSYSNIKDLYYEFNEINKDFGTDSTGDVVYCSNLIHNYCHYGNTKGKCGNYLEMTSSGVIYLLENLKKYNLEYDKLAEYAILWLRYKLNQKDPHYNTQLSEFYTNHIEKNTYYNNRIKGNGSPTYKEIIDKKKDLMNIKEMTKFSYPFKILLLLYNNNNNKKSGNCNHLDDAKKFAKAFEELINDSKNIENNSYNKMLYILSDDYNNLKNKCTNFPPLPKINTPLTKLIPALSTFSVIPVFLGIAYKYSLFGVDKLFQRQHLRKKLKKVKKKMKLNI
ncbi:PIR protein CIR protein [Plasmodium vinckei brucechwatti]|uniref:PIR protein CIR protein n=1 Tax=Plasmodium vinckei brucechwatti TaxID=119398 RepID=A0A6V7S3A8_PLAVN|nr:PIR protein CIR protein [Plasmodium vinckei brucechwatti]